MPGFGYNDNMSLTRELFTADYDDEKTSAWRYGFPCGSRVQGESGGFFAAYTEYGLQRMDTDFCHVVQNGIFTLDVVRTICQSPIRDAVVDNIIDNAIQYQILHDGPQNTYTLELLYEGYESSKGWTSGWGVMYLRKNGHLCYPVYEHALPLYKGFATIVPFCQEFVMRGTRTTLTPFDASAIAIHKGYTKQDLGRPYCATVKGQPPKGRWD